MIASEILKNVYQWLLEQSKDRVPQIKVAKATPLALTR